MIPRVCSEDHSTLFDYIVCTTKNIPGVTPSICETIAPAVRPGHTVIVLIQNGLNIEKPFLSRFPQNVILSGVSRCDAHEIAHGVIEQKEDDDLHIAAFHNPLLDQETQQKAAEQFVQIYGAGGKTNVRHEPNWERDRWSKLVYNATLNPICALTGVNTGDLQIAGSALDRLVIPAMQEVVKVSKAVGVELPDDIIETTIRKNPVERKIAPSMQKDMEKVCAHLFLHNCPVCSVRALLRYSMAGGQGERHENSITSNLCMRQAKSRHSVLCKWRGISRESSCFSDSTPKCQE